MEKLRKIQSELIAKKNMKNDFGKYSYRNIEAVLAELKPLLDKYNCHLKMTNDLIQMGNRTFIKTIATFVDPDNNYEETATSFSAIDFSHKGMSEDQCCGAAQTYCNKYCLNNLFLVDDGSADPDAQAPKETTNNNTNGENKYAHKDAVKAFYAEHPECNVKLKEKYNVSEAKYLNLQQAEEVYAALKGAGKVA